MPRPSRIEYPDAWGHAMNRERRHQTFYLGSDDHLRFLHVLQERRNDTCERPKTGRDPLVFVNPVKDGVASCGWQCHRGRVLGRGAETSPWRKRGILCALCGSVVETSLEPSSSWCLGGLVVEIS